MIRSFKHKGLERFFLSGAKSGIRPEQADKVTPHLGSASRGGGSGRYGASWFEVA